MDFAVIEGVAHRSILLVCEDAQPPKRQAKGAKLTRPPREYGLPSPPPLC